MRFVDRKRMNFGDGAFRVENVVNASSISLEIFGDFASVRVALSQKPPAALSQKRLELPTPSI